MGNGHIVFSGSLGCIAGYLKILLGLHRIDLTAINLLMGFQVAWHLRLPEIGVGGLFISEFDEVVSQHASGSLVALSGKVHTVART